MEKHTSSVTYTAWKIVNIKSLAKWSFYQKLVDILPYGIFKGMPSVAVLEKSFLTWSLLLEIKSCSEICV
jgi:hypothetical protein